MATKIKAVDYLSPLDIKEGSSGDWSVVKKIEAPNRQFTTANMRSAMFGGQRSQKLSWPHPTTWHYLKEGGATWMSDLPCEQAQMQLAINQIKRGTVLVGGLGLGLFPTMLARKKSITRIVVVEKEQDVIHLVWPYVQRKKIEIVHADLFDELHSIPNNHFDYAFYDIWQGDGEGTFFEIVCPLVELSKGKIKNPPINWQEDVMRGQIRLSIEQRIMFSSPEAIEAFGDKIPKIPTLWKEVGNIWHDWMVPYFKWRHENDPDDHTAAKAASVYCAIYGTWDWQRKWADYIELYLS